ncbi:hypothetical protein Tco_0624289 [Tanacetum coccineum]|uniref:Secreted protein n=1 Tax=Tanacetum coccineum TaxID=301880 RepID=A0ABQ4WDG4_9ASTR
MTFALRCLLIMWLRRGCSRSGKILNKGFVSTLFTLPVLPAFVPSGGGIWLLAEALHSASPSIPDDALHSAGISGL